MKKKNKKKTRTHEIKGKEEKVDEKGGEEEKGNKMGNRERKRGRVEEDRTTIRRGKGEKG